MPPTVKSPLPAESQPPVPAIAGRPNNAPPQPVGNAAEYHAGGRKLIQQEKFVEAIDQLTIAIQLDLALAPAYNARGFAYLRLKRYADAIADFDAAIRLNPTYANAYTNRAAARRASGDKAGSSADQAKALSFGSRNPPSLSPR